MEYLVKNKHWDIIEDYNCDKLLYLLIDRPDWISVNSCFVSINKKRKYHRDYDLPAIVDNLTIEWRMSGSSHREKSNPTIIWFDGKKEY